jgi:hypothetical protein
MLARCKAEKSMTYKAQLTPGWPSPEEGYRGHTGQQRSFSRSKKRTEESVHAHSSIQEICRSGLRTQIQQNLGENAYHNFQTADVQTDDENIGCIWS